MTAPTTTPSPDTGATVRPLIREWHHMNAHDQADEWTALVDWVIWIHDLYELDRETRLPVCWPQHPGLVEELRSLKAWRTAIYDSPDAAASAHTARSWHGELRQTFITATQFWAPGCRAGHKDARLLADAHPANLPERWREHGPPAMASAPATEPPPALAASGGVDQLSHDQMALALRTGAAQLHSQAVPYYAKLDGSWWTRATDGDEWLRCTDSDHHNHLDDTSARLRAADTAAAAITAEHVTASAATDPQPDPDLQHGKETP